MQQHLEAFLEEARERYARALPRYVEQELRAYVKCRILAHGVARAECRHCGEPLQLLAFDERRARRTAIGKRRGQIVCGAGVCRPSATAHFGIGLMSKWLGQNGFC